MRDNGTQAASNKQQGTTPSNFPKVDKQTQNQRDNKRKAILLSELDAEEKALASARSQNSPLDFDMHQKTFNFLRKKLTH